MHLVLRFLPKSIALILVVCLVSVLVSCSQDKKETLKVGDSAPDFSVRDLEGNVFTLSDFEGLPIVMRFFLTDCKFCRADTPMFNEYYTRYGDKHLRLIYVDSLGLDRNTLEAFKEEFKISFPVARDEGGTVAARYKVKALPQTVILDPQHKIIAAILGSSSEEEFQEILSPYLP